MDASQKQDEAQFRQVERALLYADDAARKIAKIADALKREGADPQLVEALQAGSDAVRADHRQMMKRVYFRAPDTGKQQDLLAEEPLERLAS
jgi:hypothetical protein